MDSNGPFHYLFMGYLTKILAFVIIEGSYLRFHATFDRGKSASKTRSEMFVRPSKIFVWEG
jgi:hypothetical protein